MRKIWTPDDQESGRAGGKNPMSAKWLSIRYRDFYDFPRAFVVEYGGHLYLIDAPFRSELDDYQDTYVVSRFPKSLTGRFDEASWTDLLDTGERVGEVPTRGIEFDSTSRKAINVKVFEILGLKA